MPAIITLLYGLPGSGKSTYAETFRNGNTVIVNRDAIGGTLKMLVPKVRALLEKGKSIVLDNTHLTVESREPFLQIAKELGIPIHCIIVDTPMETCQINILRRMWKNHGEIFPCGKKGDAQAFGPVVLFSARKKAEVPTEGEGFTTVRREVGTTVTWPAEKYPNKALFLDIDGTLRATEHLEHKYPTTASQVVPLHDVGAMKTALDRYKAQGYLLVGVSNQSGITKGVLSEADAEACFEATRRLFGFSAEEFPILYCPHKAAPPVCYCRKPQSGLVVEACERWGIQPGDSIMVGDMKTDETAARRMGIAFQGTEAFWKKEFTV